MRMFPIAMLGFGVLSSLPSCAPPQSAADAPSGKLGSTDQGASSPVLAASSPVLAASSPAPAEPSNAFSESTPTAAPRVAIMPPSCDDAACEPPASFTSAVCKGKYPSLAIAMFEKGTPWQRLYLRTSTLEAVNTYGSRSASDALTYGEEVLVLRGAPKADGATFQVSGATDIDLLRWDGTCVTARQEMFSTHVTASVTGADINLRHLDEPIRAALLEEERVKKSYDKQRSVCRDSRPSSPSAACEKAQEHLSQAIMVAVRAGLDVPQPHGLPAWATPEQAASASEQTRLSLND